MDDLLNENEDLNEAQKKLLEQLEEQFCDRFTEKDEDFMKVFNSPVLPPPIIDPWEPSFRDRRFNNKRRRGDYDSRNNYGKRGRYGDRRDDRRGYHNYNDRGDNRYNRDEGRRDRHYGGRYNDHDNRYRRRDQE